MEKANISGATARERERETERDRQRETERDRERNRVVGRDLLHLQSIAYVSFDIGFKTRCIRR